LQIYRDAAYAELRDERDELKAKCEALKQQLDQMEYKIQPEELPKCPECGSTCVVCGGTGKATQPPKKAVYEWQEIDDSRHYLFRNGRYCGQINHHYSPESWSWTAEGAQYLRLTTLPLARAAVEAVVRAHFGDEA
jgi:hypothetical protein